MKYLANASKNWTQLTTLENMKKFEVILKLNIKGYENKQNSIRNSNIYCKFYKKYRRLGNIMEMFQSNR